MRHIRNPRTTLVILSIYAVILLASIMAQASVSRSGHDTFLQDMPNYVRGWYGIEQSDTLTTSRGALSAQYQWTYNQAHINIWPVPAGMRLISLTYLNPLGDVDVLQNQRPIVRVMPSTQVRNAHILLPSDNTFHVMFIQTQPQVIDDRILGFIVLRFSWHSFNALDLRSSLQQWYLLLLGLPLTTMLAIALAGVARWRMRIGVSIASAPLLATMLVAWWSPWHSMAMQPIWQFMLLAGIGGLAVDMSIQRLHRIGAVSWLLVLWGVSSVLLFTPDIQGDGVGYYAYLRSLFVNGDFQFADEFRKGSAPFAFLPNYPIYEPTGYTINPWSIGPAILQVPLWLVAHVVVLITQASEITRWGADGYSAPYINMVGLTSTIAGLVTLFGIYHLLRRQFSQRIAVFSTAFVYVASNLLYYAQINNNNVHSISTATVTLMMVAFMAIQDRPTWQRWSVFGVIVGLIGIVYWVTLILCVFPAGVLLAQTRILWRTRQYDALRRLWRGIAIASVAALAVLALQSGVWYIMYHSLFTVPQGSAFAIPQYPRLWQVFFGDMYGLLWWTPALFIGIVGLWWYAKSTPTLGIWMVVAIWCYILYNASIPNWDGSSGFGFRRLASIAPFIAFGVAQVVTSTATLRQLHVILFGMLAAWTTRFALRYVEFRISRSSWTFVDDLVVATFDPAIINVNTLITVARPTWLGILWQYPNSAQLIVTVMVATCMVGCWYLWYHPFARHWWSGTDGAPRNNEGESHDSHLAQ